MQYSNKGYLDVATELVRLSKARPELVSAVGLCNFDTDHVVEICEHLLKTVGEVGVVSNQVQVGCLPWPNSPSTLLSCLIPSLLVLALGFQAVAEDGPRLRKIWPQAPDLWIICRWHGILGRFPLSFCPFVLLF